MVNKHIKEVIKEEKTARISKLARIFSLADIYVFGSRAKEIASMIRKGKIAEQLPFSDVDIGVCTLPGITLSPREISRLTIELEDLFAVNRVDVVLLSDVNRFSHSISYGENFFIRWTPSIRHDMSSLSFVGPVTSFLSRNTGWSRYSRGMADDISTD